MSDIEDYTLKITKTAKEISLAVRAYDNNHAQAQAVDILRSLKGSKFQIIYKNQKPSQLSELFRRLAFSDFSHNECYEWSGSFVKNLPVLYTLGNRFYVRSLILDYMDMHRDNFVKMTCGCFACINPYHNAYKPNKASKLTGGDLRMVVAYRSQGVSVAQIAKALKVHRSTIYRSLTNERFPSRTTGYSNR